MKLDSGLRRNDGEVRDCHGARGAPRNDKNESGFTLENNRGLLLMFTN
jgi:hypothetical protein